MKPGKMGLAGRIAHYFINSKLTPLMIAFALLLGVFAVLETPREEDPQIVVPMMDVFVSMPGATAKEVEQRVTTPMERLIWGIPGVKYVYSTTRPGESIVIVRYKVGENMEDSIVKLYNKLYSHLDEIPPGASKPLIKPRSINDVPILALTFWSKEYDGYQLRRVAAEAQHRIETIDDVSVTKLIGGERREIRVLLNPAKMAGYGIAPAAIVPILGRDNQRLQVGQFAAANVQYDVASGEFLRSAEDVGNVVIGVSQGHPIYLRNVGEIRDGPAEPNDYVLFGFGRGAKDPERSPLGDFPAVTLTVAKRKGTNAVTVADGALSMINQLKGSVIPSGVHVTVTRNYGATAQEKSNELLKHLVLATLSVTLLIALALGWRSSLVVLAAIPVTLAVTLFIYFIYGYTLNRVTLFALIFCIGILVDDAIVVIENMARHFHLPQSKGRPVIEVAVEAVDEVGNPTVLATFAVIAAILPMAFVGGMMGPYMRPIPIGASMAMLFSLFVAFTVSPWVVLRVRGQREQDQQGAGQEHEGWAGRVYRRMMKPLIYKPRKRRMFLAGVVLLLFAVCALPVLKIVIVKMLPFDNKSEFQVIVNMPDGTTLEQTANVAQRVAHRIAQEPEVMNYQVYAGTSGPMNFNGLVRHYFLRHGANQADIQVNLLPKSERALQSHDIARRTRLLIDPIGNEYGARLVVAEVPPGPPVYQTLMAEVYGPDYSKQIEVARKIRNDFRATPGVVDVDWTVEDNQPEYRISMDKVKAALNGITGDQFTRTLRLALSGTEVGLAHRPNEREDVPITLELPRAGRSSINDLEQIRLMSSHGALVPLGEVADVEQGAIEKSIYHKNLKPVVYVTGDVAGRFESPVYAMMSLAHKLDQIKTPAGTTMKRYLTQQPFLANHVSMKWDGEWQITYEVFRDLGFAFAVALVLIYVLLVAWFKSFSVPLVIMAPIPLTLVGILPAHAAMGAFFTATSIIGLIALAGIMVRNSILIVDFAALRRQQGMPLEEAVIDAGAVRFRPILLTAAAVAVGAFVILFDPIFQGLAISLMAGVVASTLLSQLATPVLYYLNARREQRREERAATPK